MAASVGRWTPEQEQRLRDLNAAGTSLTAVARELGRDKATVSRKAKALGLTWNTAPIREATEARRDRLKAARAGIVDRLYARAAHTLTRLEAPAFRTLVAIGPGVEMPTDLDFVPPQDEKALVQAMGTVLTSAARLEQVDAGADVDAARSMLGQLGDALRAVAGEPPAPEA